MQRHILGVYTIDYNWLYINISNIQYFWSFFTLFLNVPFDFYPTVMNWWVMDSKLTAHCGATFGLKTKFLHFCFRLYKIYHDLNTSMWLQIINSPGLVVIIWEVQVYSTEIKIFIKISKCVQSQSAYTDKVWWWWIKCILSYIYRHRYMWLINIF